jgi:hypothetical protein
MNKLVKFKVFMAMSMVMAVSGMLWLVGTGIFQTTWRNIPEDSDLQ